jgi:hypothetical protein
MITVEDFVARLCRLCGDPQPRNFPRRKRDREILIKSILMGFDSARSYPESEINDRLSTWLREVARSVRTDYVTIRRLLVDLGHLERTADGSRYRIGFPAGAVAFELEVDDVDLAATVAAYQDQLRRRPRPPGK